MKAIEKHYVQFLSPGTFVSEETTLPIDNWDTHLAAKMVKDIKERHGAKPYGFRFKTYLEVESIEASGEKFEVEPKEKKRSGIYFLTGKIRTAAEVLAGTDPSEHILRSNVEGNGYKAIIENNNSYRITVPFNEEDILLDMEGNVIMRGEDVN